MLRITGSIGAGFLVLAGMAHVLKIVEFSQAKQRVLARLRG
jgi:hypothetical protein